MTTPLSPLTLPTPLPNRTLNYSGGMGRGVEGSVSREDEAELQSLLWATQVIKASYMWIILVFGFPGNVLCMLVICRMRSLGSPALYISTLAVVDNLAIGIKVILIMFGKYKVSMGLAGCKLLLFLGNHLVVYANWVLVAMAIERFFAVWQPLRVAHMWTSRRAALGLTLILLLTLILTSPLFVTVTVKDIGNRQKCIADPQYRQLMTIWQWAQTAAYGFLPCTLLFSLNIAIIILISRARKLQLSLTSSSSSSHRSPTRSPSRHSHRSSHKTAHSEHCPALKNARTFSRQSSDRPSSQRNALKKTRTSSGQSTGRPTSRVQGVQRQATILLLVTSSVLVLTTTPVCVYLLVQQWWRPQTGTAAMAKKALCATVFRALCDANHAVNFYLYFISARKFRAYFWKVLCWACSRHDERRGSDVITRHFSVTRNTMRNRSSIQSQGHLVTSPRIKERNGSGGEEVDGGENHVALKVYEGKEVQCNGTTHCTSLL